MPRSPKLQRSRRFLWSHSTALDPPRVAVADSEIQTSSLFQGQFPPARPTKPIGASPRQSRTIVRCRSLVDLRCLCSWCETGFPGRTSRIRRRRRGSADDTTDAIRAVASIRFVSRLCFHSYQSCQRPPSLPSEQVLSGLWLYTDCAERSNHPRRKARRANHLKASQLPARPRPLG